jgi:hypothetical protein
MPNMGNRANDGEEAAGCGTSLLPHNLPLKEQFA